jgi:putative transposase
MNPVRAGMVASPDAYPWSSHRINVAAARARLITPHGEYLALGIGASERAAAYRALFRDQLAEERVRAIRTQTWGNGRI